MKRTSSIIIPLVFAIFVVSSGGTCFGADVAMVTDIRGAVGITLGNDKWTPSVAETLQEGSSIQLEDNAVLAIVHLGLNQEFEIKGPKNITLSKSGVDGDSSISGKQIKEISSNLDLQARHFEEGGTVDAQSHSIDAAQAQSSFEGNKDDEGIKPGTPATEKLERMTDARDSGRTLLEPAKNVGQIDSPDSDAHPSQAGSVGVGPETSPAGKQAPPEEAVQARASPPLPAPQQSALGGIESRKSRDSLPIKPPRAIVALPKGLFSKSLGEPKGRLKKDQLISLEKTEARIASWTLFSLAEKEFNSEKAIEISLVPESSGIKAPMTVHWSILKSQNQLVLALAHEAQNRFEQAAAIWLTLLATDPRQNAALIARHLSRLEEKIKGKLPQK